MTALANYDDLVAFTHEQTVKDLLSNDGADVVDPADDPGLATLMQAASGRLEAACGVSALYSPSDLAVLVAANGNTAALIKEIVCSLTLLSLVRRQPEKWGSEYWQNIRDEYEGKNGYLDRLRHGERLFDDPLKREAGTPSVDGPSAIDCMRLNLISSRTHNFFPSVAQRLPLGRQ